MIKKVRISYNVSGVCEVQGEAEHFGEGIARTAYTMLGVVPLLMNLTYLPRQ
jgi:hypothetical protein